MHLRASVVCAALLLALCSSAPAGEGLVLSERGEGLDHVIQVELPGRLRLGFEAGYGYGLTQWFDLSHDPEGKTDLAHSPVATHPDAKSIWGINDTRLNYLREVEQGSLINTVYYPEDYHAYIAYLKKGHLHSGVPRSCKVLESNPLRVVLESRSVPVYSRKAMDEEGPFLECVTRFHIYANGRILARTTTIVRKQYTSSFTRNGVLGVGDPTYSLDFRSGSTFEVIDDTHVRMPDAGWKPGEWTQRVFTTIEGSGTTRQDREYSIVNNTADTLELKKGHPLKPARWSIGGDRSKLGWLRATDAQDPYTYSAKPARYLFMHWDKTTPEPWTDWTKASVLLVPHPSQKYAGNSMHGWLGHKRFDFQIQKQVFGAGSEHVQLWMLQLGTEKDAMLPDIASIAAAERQGRWYIDQLEFPGAKLNAVEGTLDLTIDPASPLEWKIPSDRVLPKPVLAVRNATVAGLSMVINGEAVKDNDVISAKTAAGDLLVLITRDLEPGATLTIAARKQE